MILGSIKLNRFNNVGFGRKHKRIKSIDKKQKADVFVRQKEDKNIGELPLKKKIDNVVPLLRDWLLVHNIEERTVEGCKTYISNLINDDPKRYASLHDCSIVPCNTSFTVYDHNNAVSIGKKAFIKNADNILGNYTMYFDKGGFFEGDEIATIF